MFMELLALFVFETTSVTNCSCLFQHCVSNERGFVAALAHTCVLCVIYNCIYYRLFDDGWENAYINVN